MINIAIVDNYQIFIHGLKNVFEKQADFKIVLTANNGVEALENKLLDQVDIFILDVEMPNMDGIELSKKILSQFPEAKILILSIYNDSLTCVLSIKLMQMLLIITVVVMMNLPLEVIFW